MNSPHTTKNHGHPRSSGFALVISLALMGFILLLLLSLTTFVQVEVQSAETSQSRLKAEQNALLSMQIALGELQKTMGPDQRVSATAGILSNTTPTRQNAVGVWSSADVTLADSNGTNYSEGELLGWLASDARDQNGGLSLNYNQDPLGALAERAILIGAGSLDSDGDGVADDPLDQVIVDMGNTQILSSDGQTAGRYAWWVGDESLKARINLKVENENTTGTTEKLRNLYALNSLPFANASALPGLETVHNNESLPNAVSLAQIEILAGASQNIDKTYFKHLTPFGAGVLADVKNGGLKKDLSLAFEMDDADFDVSEFAANGSNAYAPWDPAIYGPLPNQGFEVQPIFTFDDSTYSNGSSFEGTAIGPTWHALRDYYRLYHEVEDIMGTPTMNARVFGPNYNHRKYDLDPVELMDGHQQPANIYGPGPSSPRNVTGGRFGEGNWPAGKSTRLRMDMDTYPWQNGRPIGFVAGTNPFMLSRMLEQDAQGDPLRSTNGSIPPLLGGNYMPIMIRSILETGAYSRKPGPASRLHRLRPMVRSTYVVHNPFNVALRHDDMYLRMGNTSVALTLYEYDTDTVFIYDANEDGIKEDGPRQQDKEPRIDSARQDIFHRAVVRGGTFLPGEIKAFAGDSDDGTLKYAPEVSSVGEGTWASVRESGLFQIGPTLKFPLVDPNPNSERGLFTLKAVISGDACSTFGNVHTGTTFGAYQHMRDRLDQSVPGNETNPSADQWPMALSVNPLFLTPGVNYDSGGNAARTVSEYRVPILDPDYINASNAAGWRYAFIQDFDYQNDRAAQSPVPTLTLDLQLKPSGFLTHNNGLALRYPTYAMTSPLAPTKDGHQFLPAGDVRAGDVDKGYPDISPGWEINISPSLENNSADYTFWGSSDGALDGVFGGQSNVVVLEIPTSPPLSIGKLQHANISVYDHMPSLAIGNSLASPYIARDSVYAVNENQYGNERIFYDLSYLMNEALWDSYFFSSLSIPFAEGADYDADNREVSESFDSVFITKSNPSLPNPRMLLHQGEGEEIADIRQKLFENDEIEPGGYQRVAENMMVAGSFNVNSTSVEAWQAVLSGSRDLQIYRSDQDATESIENDVILPRLSRVTQGDHSGSANSDTAWGGFKSFTDEQIELLAQNIVAELRARTAINQRPFLSLSDFVNRNLSDDEYGLAGLIQAAIDRTSSLGNDTLDSGSEIPSELLDGTSSGSLIGTRFPHPENMNNNISGTPRSAAMSSSAYTLQGDILQAIGSFLSVRGDCFRIRAYGESLSLTDSGPEARVWCEAIVQRIPEPAQFRNGTTPDDVEYWTAQDAAGNAFPLGRKFKIISFRWMTEDEV